MASLNKVLLMGNLTRDPELRYIPSGSAVASFTLAMNRVYKLQTGEKKEETTFIRVVVWGRMAEICGEYITKGSPVFVEGRLTTRNWEAQDGQKRTTTEVIASNVQFLRGANSSSQAKERNDFTQDNSPKDEMGEIQLDEGSHMGSDSEVPF